MSLGTTKLKKIGMIPSIIGAALAFAGCMMINWAATDIKGTPNPDRIVPMDPKNLTFYIVLCVVMIVLSIVIFLCLPKVEKGEKCYIETKYQLFLLLLPFWRSVSCSLTCHCLDGGMRSSTTSREIRSRWTVLSGLSGSHSCSRMRRRGQTWCVCSGTHLR